MTKTEAQAVVDALDRIWNSSVKKTRGQSDAVRVSRIVDAISDERKKARETHEMSTPTSFDQIRGDLYVITKLLGMVVERSEFVLGSIAEVLDEGGGEAGR